MAEANNETHKLVRKYVFIFQDSRANSQQPFVGQGFVLQEGDSVGENENGDIVFNIEIVKTVKDDKTLKAVLMPTGVKQLVAVRKNSYLWSEYVEEWVLRK